MKAIVYYGPKDIRFDASYPEPQIQEPTDVKLKIHYCGICGSDLHEYTDGPTFFAPPGENHSISNKPYPHIMGHEMSAEIVEVGSDVNDFSVGDSVVVEVTGTCMDRDRFEGPNEDVPKCEACTDGHYNACTYLGLTGLGFTDGGFAEYVVTSSSKLVKFDKNKINYDVAALIQPLAVSWHAVRLSNFEEGQTALVLGGGPIGLTTIFALKGHGASKIVVSEPSSGRRKLAESLGVDTFDPTGKSVEECVSILKKMTSDGYGFHRSFDCSGVPATFDTSVKALRIRGVATNVAVWAHRPIDYYPMMTTWSEKSVKGSICFVKEDFEAVANAIEEGHIDQRELKSLISAEIPLERAVEEGFDELIKNKEKHIKLLFTPLA
ncbi:CIC11C00000005746 [Sungouiella intermedia]|uniref:CIC11C00000005746 n=1 Tax=Sungouiella intermedia TaxID=45354 RepID=A0A1L0BMS0_9ASCO|nr:CIC11C00000005746 [[Candida] intermedia]